jgi:hypothetical protein
MLSPFIFGHHFYTLKMKRVFGFLLSIFCFKYVSAQRSQLSHSIRIEKGFANTSDLGYEEEMSRSFQGLGYRYKTRGDWYIGTEVQYHQNTLNSSRLLPLQLQGEGTLYACRVPGGENETGYFFVPESMQSSVNIITNNNVYKSQQDQLPFQTQSLRATRLNFMLHGGKSWEVGRGVIEAGVTITSTFYNRDIVVSSRQQQAISCRSLTTGELYNTMFDVTTFKIVDEKTTWIGAGVHARYQYPVTKNLSVGLQLLSSASVEGLLLQAAPYMAFGF